MLPESKGRADQARQTVSSARRMGWAKAYAVAFVSLLSGAAVVHNIYQPDLVRGLFQGLLQVLFCACYRPERLSRPSVYTSSSSRYSVRWVTCSARSEPSCTMHGAGWAAADIAPQMVCKVMQPVHERAGGVQALPLKEDAESSGMPGPARAEQDPA
jgi:hypothetical protein